VARATAATGRQRVRELADWVAEVAVECGLTLAEARDHSLAQLRLLAEAARRLRARDALIDSQVMFAAAAAVMHKDNQTILRTLQERLARQADGD
jgi:hypothetical protein